MNFLDLSYEGKNSLGRYFAGLVVILLVWAGLGIIIGVVALVGLMFAEGVPLSALGTGSSTTILSPLSNYIVMNISFLFLILGVFLAIRYVHQRRFKSLITPYKKINWRMILFGLLLWTSIMILCTIGDFIINRDNYVYVWDVAKFLKFLPLALIATPIQCFAEELLFRGYILQGLARLTRNPFWLATISGILFALPHLGNPELNISYLFVFYYFGIGALLALVTIQSGSLELAIGTHSANNLFSLAASYQNSAIPGVAPIFYVQELSVASTFVQLVVAIALFYIIILRVFKKRVKSTDIMG